MTMAAAVQAVADVTAGVSFNSSTGVLSFDENFAGSIFTFSLTAVDDDVPDDGETITGTLSNATVANGTAGITIASATTTITDIDAGVTYSISSTTTISEEAEETATFTLTLGGDALVSGNTSSIDITLTGSSSSGVDYSSFMTALGNKVAATAGVTLSGNTLTFTEDFNGGTGTGSLTFTVSAIDDNHVEGSESIIATLSNPVIDSGGATIGTTSATTTITELDAGMTYAISSTSSISEELGETTIFTIVLGGGALSGGNISTVVITPSGSATSGVDYENFLDAVSTAAALTTGISFNSSARTLTFDSSFNGNSGAGSFTFSMDAIDDQDVEGIETIVGTLSGATISSGTVSIITPQSTTNIIELDANLTYSISSTATVSEETTDTATFTITLGGDSLTGTNTSSVVISQSGTGTSGTDYDSFVTAIENQAAVTTGVTFDNTAHELTFDSTFNGGSGTGTFSFTLDAIDDTDVEGTETIIATLSAATIDNGSATIILPATTTSILEQDADIDYAIVSTLTISEDTEETAIFSVILSGNAPLTGINTSSVVITPAGSATSGTDYQNFITALTNAAASTVGVSYDNGTQTLTFDSGFNGGRGAGTFSFTMAAINDTDVEGSETIVANLSTPTVDSGTVAISQSQAVTTIFEPYELLPDDPVIPPSEGPDENTQPVNRNTPSVPVTNMVVTGENRGSTIITTISVGDSGPGTTSFVTLTSRPSDSIFTTSHTSFTPGYIFENNPISITAELNDQFVTQGIVRYSVGDGKFQHSDPSESLIYQASLIDGSSLPSYVEFNSENAVFLINADLARQSGVDSILIKVMASDSKGNESNASFQINFSENVSVEEDDDIEVIGSEGNTGNIDGTDDAGTTENEPDAEEETVEEQNGETADVYDSDLMKVQNILLDYISESPADTQGDAKLSTTQKFVGNSMAGLSQQIQNAGIHLYQTSKSNLVKSMLEFFSEKV